MGRTPADGSQLIAILPEEYYTCRPVGYGSGMRNLVFILFLIAFLSLVAGVNIYLSRRFSYYFGMAHINRIYLVSGLLTVFMLGGIRVFTNSVDPLGHTIYMAASVLIGFALYLIMSVILVDLIHLFVKAKPVLLGITAIAVAVIVFSYGIWHAYNPKITTTEIPIKGITQEIRAMHISDIHLGHFRGKKYMRKIVEATRGLNIDIVFLTGDLFDGKIKPQEEAISPLEQLEVPVYFVEGNHDGYAGPESIKQKLRKKGMFVLENEVARWGEWQIIGLDYMEAYSPSHDSRALREGAAIRDILPTLGIDPAKPFCCTTVPLVSSMSASMGLTCTWQVTPMGASCSLLPSWQGLCTLITGASMNTEEPGFTYLRGREHSDLP